MKTKTFVLSAFPLIKKPDGNDFDAHESLQSKINLIEELHQGKIIQMMFDTANLRAFITVSVGKIVPGGMQVLKGQA